MNFPKDEQLRLWSRELSLFTALVVCLLSWLNGNDFSRIIFKAGTTFLVIYGLVAGCLFFFRKTAYLDINEDIVSQNLKGTMLDVSLGDSDAEQNENPIDIQNSNLYGVNSNSNENETGLSSPAGQVDPDFISGVISHKQQADIIKRMGWKEE